MELLFSFHICVLIGFSAHQILYIEETKLASSSEKITQIQAFKAYCVRYRKDAGKKSRFAAYFVVALADLFALSIKKLLSQYFQDLGQDILSQKNVEKTSQAL